MPSQPPELSEDESPAAVAKRKKEDAQGSGLELALTPEEIKKERKERSEKAARAKEFVRADKKERERMSEAEDKEREDRAEQEAKEALHELGQTWKRRIHEGSKRIDAKVAEAGTPLLPAEKQEQTAIDAEAEGEFDRMVEELNEVVGEKTVTEGAAVEAGTGESAPAAAVKGERAETPAPEVVPDIGVTTDKAGMEFALAEDAKKWAPTFVEIPEPPVEATMSKSERVFANVKEHGDALRKIAFGMRSQRKEVAELRAQLDKYSGLGAVRGIFAGGRMEKGRLTADLAEAEKAYETMRAEYVGEKTYRKNKEEMLLADAAGAALTKEKGVSGKIYEAYKWLGDQNLTKLGWKPQGKIKGALARGISLRSGVNVALLAGGGILGGAAGILAVTPFTRGIGGVSGAIGSFDAMRHFWDKQKSVSIEDVRKMEPAALLSRMDALRAQAMLGGRAVSADAEYLRLKAEFGKREKSALERGLLTTGYLNEAMGAADARLEKAKTKRKIAGAAMKGVAAGVGYAIGSGAVADAISGAKENVGAGYDIIRERLMRGAEATGEAVGKAAEAPIVVGDTDGGVPQETAIPQEAPTSPDILPAAPEEAPPAEIVAPEASPDILPAAPPETDVTAMAPEQAGAETIPAEVAAGTFKKGISLDEALLKPGEEVTVHDAAADAVIAKVKAALDAAPKEAAQADVNAAYQGFLDRAREAAATAEHAADIPGMLKGLENPLRFMYGGDGKIVGVVGEHRYGGTHYKDLVWKDWKDMVNYGDRAPAVVQKELVGALKNLDAMTETHQQLDAAGLGTSPEATYLAEKIASERSLITRTYGDIFHEGVAEKLENGSTVGELRQPEAPPVVEAPPPPETSFVNGRLTYEGGRATFETDGSGHITGVAVEGSTRGIPSVLPNGYEMDFSGGDYADMGETWAVDKAQDGARTLSLEMRAYEAMKAAGKADTAEAKFLLRTIRSTASELRQSVGPKFLKDDVFKTIYAWEKGGAVKHVVAASVEVPPPTEFNLLNDSTLTFKHGPSGEITSYTLQYEGVPQDPQDALKPGWMETAQAASGSKNINLMRTTIESRVRRLMQDMAARDIMEGQGQGKTPEAAFLRKAIELKTKALEKQFGDIMR